MDATLNVRMSAPLKARGDEVLKKFGISTSTAVRALWQELASTRTLPPFLEAATKNAETKRAKTDALNALAGVAEGELSLLTDEQIEAIGASRYE